MEVAYTKDEYKQMQKEVCYLVNEIKQRTDTICSSQDWNDFTLQANLTCEVQAMCDMLKNYLVQMNFITCNVAMRGGVNNEYRDINNNDALGDFFGDNMELHESEEVNSELLETSKTRYDEETDKGTA